MAGNTLTGDKLLDRRLRHLSERGSKRALAAGIRASMTPIHRAIRAGIKASDASDELKRAARQAIGKRFRKGGVSKIGKVTTPVALVGFGVGKRKSKGTGEGKSRGVGISASNIHWFVLGTAKRQLKTGQPTGKIEPPFAGVVQQAFANSQGAALAAARRSISRTIAREARKQA